MQRWMAAHAVPRGSLAVTFDNRLVFVAGYGGRGVNERVPVWSLSKAITALCVASLIKDGRLRLDDPIGPHLARAFERFGKPADKRRSPWGSSSVIAAEYREPSTTTCSLRGWFSSLGSVRHVRHA